MGKNDMVITLLHVVGISVGAYMIYKQFIEKPSQEKNNNANYARAQAYYNTARLGGY